MLEKTTGSLSCKPLPRTLTPVYRTTYKLTNSHLKVTTEPFPSTTLNTCTHPVTAHTLEPFNGQEPQVQRGRGQQLQPTATRRRSCLLYSRSFLVLMEWLCRQAICLPRWLSVGVVPQLGHDLLGRCGFGLGLGFGF